MTVSGSDSAAAAHESTGRPTGAEGSESVAPASRRELFRLVLRERGGPDPGPPPVTGHGLAGFPFTLQGRRVLEIGSGRGDVSDALAGAGARVVPLDLRRTAVRVAADAGRPAVRADAARLPFAAEAFDGVVCSHRSGSGPVPAAALAEIHRVLGPGGWALVDAAPRDRVLRPLDEPAAARPGDGRWHVLVAAAGADQ